MTIPKTVLWLVPALLCAQFASAAEGAGTGGGKAPLIAVALRSQAEIVKAIQLSEPLSFKDGTCYAGIYDMRPGACGPSGCVYRVMAPPQIWTQLDKRVDGTHLHFSLKERGASFEVDVVGDKANVRIAAPGVRTNSIVRITNRTDHFEMDDFNSYTQGETVDNQARTGTHYAVSCGYTALKTWAERHPDPVAGNLNMMAANSSFKIVQPLRIESGDWKHVRNILLQGSDELFSEADLDKLPNRGAHLVKITFDTQVVDMKQHNASKKPGASFPAYTTFVVDHVQCRGQTRREDGACVKYDFFPRSAVGTLESPAADGVKLYSVSVDAPNGRTVTVAEFEKLVSRYFKRVN